MTLVWLRNRRYDRPAAGGDVLLPPSTAWVLAVVGGLALLTGLWLFLLPNVAIGGWPWHLTPLTARVLGAVFCLGLAGLGAPLDRRWSSARIPFQVAAVMLVLLLIAGVRAHAQFAAANPQTWLFAAGFAAVTLAVALVYLRMERLAHR